MSQQSASDQRSRDGFRAFLAVLVVAVVGLAMVGMPVIYGGATTTAEAAEPTATVESYETISQAESELPPADEVYLREDGSAVLQYDDDEMDDVSQLDLGMDVSEGLAYMLIAGEYDEGEMGDEFEEGQFSAILDEDGLAGDGSFVMQQPEDLESLDLDVSGEVSDETNEFDVTASGAFDGDDSAPTTVSTDGQVTATADRLETSGSASVAVDDSPVPTSEGQSFDAALQETNSGYVVDVSDERIVENASNWETRQQAKETLTEQYGSIAMEIGGNSDVTIESYSFDDSQNRLEIEFTIEYTDIDNGIEQGLPLVLMNDDIAGLDQPEAQAVATGLTELEIETIELSFDDSGDSIEAEWNVVLENYDELTLAMLDAVEATATSEELDQMNIDDSRAAIEAQQAAGLETNVQWDASLEQTVDGELQFDVDASGDTENWAAYVAELESRGIESPAAVSFDLTAEADGDQLSMSGQFEVGGQDLADQAIDAMAGSAQTAPTGSPEADQFVTALSESDLEVARVDASVGDGTIRVEGGAKFDDMSALTDTVVESMAISGVATEMDGDSASMYVYVDDMGEVDTVSATKSDVDHLGVVDDETTVHQAGEWDEEFPETDNAEIRDYLGVDETGTDDQADEDGDDDDDSVPGFGPGIALASIAGLLTALMLRRRS